MDELETQIEASYIIYQKNNKRNTKEEILRD